MVCGIVTLLVIIFQLRENSCNITHEINFFLFTTDIFRTKTDVPRIFLEHEYFSAGTRHVLLLSQHDS